MPQRRLVIVLKAHCGRWLLRQGANLQAAVGREDERDVAKLRPGEADLLGGIGDRRQHEAPGTLRRGGGRRTRQQSVRGDEEALALGRDGQESRLLPRRPKHRLDGADIDIARPNPDAEPHRRRRGMGGLCGGDPAGRRRTAERTEDGGAQPSLARMDPERSAGNAVDRRKRLGLLGLEAIEDAWCLDGLVVRHGRGSKIDG